MTGFRVRRMRWTIVLGASLLALGPMVKAYQLDAESPPEERRLCVFRPIVTADFGKA
jgi:hypothetical protein